MKHNEYLAGRLREVLLSGKWIANTNVKEQISGLPWQQAVMKTAGLNTVAALTFHLDYYIKGLITAFSEGRLEISDKYSFDMPPVRTEHDWKQMTDEFIRHAEIFAGMVEKMEEDELELPFIDQQYGTRMRNIEAVIEHSYYHLGQMVLIRKLTEGKEEKA